MNGATEPNPERTLSRLTISRCTERDRMWYVCIVRHQGLAHEPQRCAKTTSQGPLALICAKNHPGSNDYEHKPQNGSSAGEAGGYRTVTTTVRNLLNGVVGARCESTATSS